MARNGTGRIFLGANPDLADILGDMDLDFENFHFCHFWGFQISGLPGFQVSKIWSGPGLGQAGPGLSHLNQKMMIFYCQYWCLSLRPAVSSRRDENKCHQAPIFVGQNERRVPANLSRPLSNTVRTPIASSVWGIMTFLSLNILKAINLNSSNNQTL